jgi:hypothetical protein
MHFQASVLREQPFTFEVDFELVGPKAEQVARNKIGWSAETRTFDPASGTSQQLCESGPNSFEKGHLKYELSLPEILPATGILPRVGTYNPGAAFACPARLHRHTKIAGGIDSYLLRLMQKVGQKRCAWGHTPPAHTVFAAFLNAG